MPRLNDCAITHQIDTHMSNMLAIKQFCVTLHILGDEYLVKCLATSYHSLQVMNQLYI